MKTLTVDSSKRVRLPDSKPGQVYSYENHGTGVLTLTRVKHDYKPREPKAVVGTSTGYETPICALCGEPLKPELYFQSFDGKVYHEACGNKLGIFAMGGQIKGRAS
jgi:hypothetical protein